MVLLRAVKVISLGRSVTHSRESAAGSLCNMISQIKLFLDEFFNKIWCAPVTILNSVGINFSCKSCDLLESSGFAGKSI